MKEWLSKKGTCPVCRVQASATPCERGHARLASTKFDFYKEVVQQQVDMIFGANTNIEFVQYDGEERWRETIFPAFFGEKKHWRETNFPELTGATPSIEWKNVRKVRVPPPHLLGLIKI